MRLEGYDVKENPNLTFRNATEKDKDIEGNSIPEGYFVFVKLKDCKIEYTEDGKQFYNSIDAPVIPIVYIDYYYGMGEFKKRRQPEGIEIDEQIVTEYNQAPLYFAYSGKVYVGSLRTLL